MARIRDPKKGNGPDSSSTEPGLFFCDWHPEIVESRRSQDLIGSVNTSGGMGIYRCLALECHTLHNETCGAFGAISVVRFMRKNLAALLAPTVD